MAKVLVTVLCVVMAGCSSLPPSGSRLELPELLSVSGGEESRAAARTETRTPPPSERRAGEDQPDRLASETDWSPTELYGDSADRWLWDLNRADYRLPSALPVAHAEPARTPLFKRAKSPSNFFLISTAATESETPPGTGTEGLLPNPLEPLRESRPDTPVPPAESAAAPKPNATTACSEPPAPQPQPPAAAAAVAAAAATVEPPQQAADWKSPPHPQIPQPARLAIVNPCFCRAVRARGDCVPADSARFRVGQKILVYCEVEDAVAKTGSQQAEPRRVQFSGSLMIKNRDGAVVHELAFGAGPESTVTAESPAYVVLPTTIPGLPAETYQLFVGLADISTGQFAMSAEPLPFELVAESPPAVPRR